MAQWAVSVPAEEWATERLFHHDTVTVSGDGTAVGADDEVLLLAGDAVVALTRAAEAPGTGELVLTYLRRAFDAPIPAGGLVAGPVPTEDFRRFAAALGAEPPLGDRRTWLVSVAMPIEAATPADAVRQFWSHVRELGPVELPAYVWPSGDELAMQAFVLGAEANQDPEEEDED